MDFPWFLNISPWQRMSQISQFSLYLVYLIYLFFKEGVETVVIECKQKVIKNWSQE